MRQEAGSLMVWLPLSAAQGCTFYLDLPGLRAESYAIKGKVYTIPSGAAELQAVITDHRGQVTDDPSLASHAVLQHQGQLQDLAGAAVVGIAWPYACVQAQELLPVGAEVSAGQPEPAHVQGPVPLWVSLSGRSQWQAVLLQAYQPYQGLAVPGMEGLVATTTGYTGYQKRLHVLQLRAAGVMHTKEMRMDPPAPGNFGCTHLLARDPTEEPKSKQGVAKRTKLAEARYAVVSLARHEGTHF